MVNQKIRIRLKAFDHRLLDQSAEKIVGTARRTGAVVSDRFPCRRRRAFLQSCVRFIRIKIRGEQFEMRTHKRLIDILEPGSKTVDL